MENKYMTSRQLILLRDSLPLEELKEQTRQTRERFGYVDYRGIFKIMGYVHAYNDKFEKIK
jgi:hypothetical protein